MSTFLRLWVIFFFMAFSIQYVGKSVGKAVGSRPILALAGIRFEYSIENCMWTLSMNPEDIIEIDYKDLNFPATFLAFKPILFKNNGIYCCLLGPNHQEGIFGFGNSASSAISLWDLEFKKRLMDHSKNDQIAHFISYKIRLFSNLLA